MAVVSKPVGDGCCRRRPGQFRLQRVKPATLAGYKRALRSFVEWLDEVGKCPAKADEWDDCVVIYAADRALSASSMHALINALELFFPKFKRQFQEARAEADGLQTTTPVVHKAPMCRGPCCLFAARAAEIGQPRKGIALIVQNGAGLRPSEVLALFPEHVAWQDSIHGPVALLRLGALVSTKARREQVAFIYKSEDPHAYELLQRLVEVTPDNHRLFDFSYAAYHRFIRDTCDHFHIDVAFSGHGPRAGFASERIARGESASDVQRRGRWKVPSSFEIYVDVVLASQIDVSFKLSGLSEAITFTHAYLLDYFSVASLAATADASKEGKERRHSRPSEETSAGSRGRARDFENTSKTPCENTVSARGKGHKVVAVQPDFLGPPIGARAASCTAASASAQRNWASTASHAEGASSSQASCKRKIRPPKR